MTSIETFFEKFTADASRAIKKTVLIANPVECGLYGHHQIDASDHLKEQYMNSATADSFVVEDQENCW